MTKKKKVQQLDPIEAIRRLLILQLLAANVSTEAIAQVLGIDSSTIRHMVSLKEVKKANK